MLAGGLLLMPMLIMPVLIRSVLLITITVVPVERSAREDWRGRRYALDGQSVDDVHGSPSLDTLSRRLNRKSYRFLKATTK